jgi:futalosine hydrolase
VRLLLVSATSLEIAPLVSTLTPCLPSDRPLAHYRAAGHDVDVLTTGVGMVATAVWCSRALTTHRYDAAINLGVCGSFRPGLEPPAVVHVTGDRLAELGAEDGEDFLTVHALGLLDDNEFPFRAGVLANTGAPLTAAVAALPAVRSITVNTVHGNARTIARVVERFDPDVESMEGAAFMYACLAAGISFAQVRAVSNVVERRNRAAWDLPGAIRLLCETGRTIIDQL